MPNDDLKNACDALRVRDVWAEAFAEGIVTIPPPDRDGLTPSPFREDGRRASFSICYDGRGFKDFGGTGISGGSWKFHELCWPNLPKNERAKSLIALAAKLNYIVPAAPKIPGTKPPPGTPAIDPLIEKAAKALERRERGAAAERQVYDERDRLLRPEPPKAIPSWPDCVSSRYADGISFLRENPAKMTDMAKARGWPELWGWELLEQNLISFPWERWARPGEKFAGRQKAFAVQIPRARGMGKIELETIGYHQRFFEVERENKPAKKGWLYLPSLPRKTPASDYERELAHYGETLGVDMKAEAKPSLVPPLPFALGDFQNTKLIVLLEGQWDAISFFGACDFFHDTTPPEGIAVFGIRGAQGIDAFLSYWSDWLFRQKPRAWLIADNDAAGGAWRDAPPAKPGLPRPPNLSEKLVAVGCRDPLVSWLTPGRWGKDFNDYYRAAKPTSKAMRNWMCRVGIISKKGDFS